MALDSRFSEGQMNPGRRTQAGAPAPTQAAPSAPRPQAPTVPQAPIGRPAGGVARPPTPAPGAPARLLGTAAPTPAATPAAAAAAAGTAGKPPGWAAPVMASLQTAGGGSWGQAIENPSLGGLGKISGPAGGFMSPEQQQRAAAVSDSPGQASLAASTNHFEKLAGAQAAPAALVTPAAAGGAAGGGAAVGGGGGGGWSESVSKTNVTGGIGDPEIDAALKGAVMGQLRDDPYSAEKLAAAKAQQYDSGMAGVGAQRESINADAVRRGLGRTSVGAELGSEAESAARASTANQQRETMTEFAKLSDNHKQQAIASAQNLATDLANRGISIEQMKMQREANRGGGGGGYDPNKPIEMVDDEGNVTQVDPRILDLALGMFEGGYE